MLLIKKRETFPKGSLKMIFSHPSVTKKREENQRKFFSIEPV